MKYRNFQRRWTFFSLHILVALAKGPFQIHPYIQIVYACNLAASFVQLDTLPETEMYYICEYMKRHNHTKNIRLSAKLWSPVGQRQRTANATNENARNAAKRDSYALVRILDPNMDITHSKSRHRRALTYTVSACNMCTYVCTILCFDHIEHGILVRTATDHELFEAHSQNHHPHFAHSVCVRVCMCLKYAFIFMHRTLASHVSDRSRKSAEAPLDIATTAAAAASADGPQFGEYALTAGWTRIAF